MRCRRPLCRTPRPELLPGVEYPVADEIGPPDRSPLDDVHPDIRSAKDIPDDGSQPPNASAQNLVPDWRVSLPAVLDEIVLHGWDLAVATGQDFRPDDAPAFERALGYAGRDPHRTP